MTSVTTKFVKAKNVRADLGVIDNLRTDTVTATTVTANLFIGPTSARTVRVPITGLYPPTLFFGFQIRRPILGVPIDIATGGPVPELSIIVDPVLGDKVVSTVDIASLWCAYGLNYTRAPVVNNPLPAGAVVSYAQRDALIFNDVSLPANYAIGIPNVNTWFTTVLLPAFEVATGTTITFLTLENLPGSSTVLDAQGDVNFYITFKS